MNETEEVKTEDETDLIPVPPEEVLAEADEGTEEEETTPSTDAPESSADDEEPEEETPTVPVAPTKPAPVPGETERERALRLELTRVKGLLRTKDVSTLVTEPKVDVPDERLAKLRERYSDEEISSMEEAIDTLAAKRGYVKADQSYQSTVNATLESFTDTHPEYKPEQDTDDIRWGRFKNILESGIYNLSGKSAKQLNMIFEKVHKDVQEELGEAAIASKPREQAAQQQKVRSVSHSGGTKSTPQKKSVDLKSIEENTGVRFKGFDEEDFS